MNKIKNQIKLVLALMMIVTPLAVATRVFAAPTGVVNATVTPMNISVTVADGSVSYGTVDLSSNRDTSSSGVDDTQVATNSGNLAEDFNIMSSDATGGVDWTLAGTVGDDQYKHSFCTSGGGAPDPCDSGPSWTAMSAGYAALASNVGVSGTQRFDLRIDTPSSVSDYVQKSITVTVQAVMH